MHLLAEWLVRCSGMLMICPDAQVLELTKSLFLNPQSNISPGLVFGVRSFLFPDYVFEVDKERGEPCLLSLYICLLYWLVVEVGLLVTIFQVTGDLQDYCPTTRGGNVDRSEVFLTRFANIRKLEVYGVPGSPVIPAHAVRDDSIARSNRRFGPQEQRVHETIGAEQLLQVEPIAAPVDLEIVRHIQVAMELKAVSHSHTTRGNNGTGANGATAGPATPCYGGVAEDIT